MNFGGILVYEYVIVLGICIALQLFHLGTNDQYVPTLGTFGPILAILWLLFFYRVLRYISVFSTVLAK